MTGKEGVQKHWHVVRATELKFLPVNYAGSSPSTSCNHRRFPWYVYSHTHIYVDFTLYSGFLCI